MIVIKKARKQTRPILYPLGEMAVGDILEVDKESGSKIRTAVCQFVKNNQPTWKFKTKTVGDKVQCKREK